MECDIEQYCFITKRASFEVYKKFGINKLELWLLCSLSWHLRVKNKIVVSKTAWFDQVTGNKREQSKMEGYFSGLLKHGFIGTFEYVSQPGSCSVGISELGVSVIVCYRAAIADFKERYPQSPYRLDGLTPSFLAEPPLQYLRIA